MKMSKLLMLALSLSLLLGLSLPDAAKGAHNGFMLASIKTESSGAGKSAAASQRAMQGGVRLVSRPFRERGRRRLKYTIDVKYPQLVGAKGGAQEQFNRAVRDLIMGEVSDFKKNLGPPDSSIPGGMLESSFDAGYDVGYSGPDLISLSFGISVYNAGAAHPNHYTLVLNYDLNSGRALSLSDLFKPRTSYMQTISDYTIKALKKELGPEPDTEWIERGAGPDSENYKSWTVTRRGLVVIFDPYQVASYAEGSHIVTIPYSVLRNFVNTDGPLATLARQSPPRRAGR